MQFYALLHAPTGSLMPARTSAAGTSIGGHTHWMPDKPGDRNLALTVGPRLFTRRSAAERARLAWLRGYCIRQYAGTTPDLLDAAHGWAYMQPDPPRQPDDLIVVEAFLHLPQYPNLEYRTAVPCQEAEHQLDLHP